MASADSEQIDLTQSTSSSSGCRDPSENSQVSHLGQAKSPTRYDLSRKWRLNQDLKLWRSTGQKQLTKLPPRISLLLYS